MTDHTSSIHPDDGNEPEHLAYEAEDEIDLVELIKPLWQQKIFIAGFTFLVVALAVVLVLKATPQYKIYVRLKPGTYRWDSKGTPIPYLKTADLKGLITGGAFDIYTAEAGLGDKAPKVGASSNRRGDQLAAYFFWPDPTEGKKIMGGFIDFLNDFDRGSSGKKLSGLRLQRLALDKTIKKFQEEIKAADVQKQKVVLNIKQKKGELKLVDLQKDRLQRKIERVNADARMAEKRISFLDERISVAEETLTGYEKSRREIDENTTRIIALRDQLLQAPPDDSLQLLLLASTIQQNISYLNTLEQKIEAVRKEIISHRTAKAELIKEQEKYRLAIADLRAKIKLEIPKQKTDIRKEITELELTVNNEIPSKIALLNQKISELDDKINAISLVEMVDSPQASIKPEKPKKRKIVALAGIMGLFLAVILAYLRHFWLANKDKLR
jgi:LPS O-antigen subunit length determinant protein (WzzB/FepE family)